jgi:hypothetical protein
VFFPFKTEVIAVEEERFLESFNQSRTTSENGDVAQLRELSFITIGQRSELVHLLNKIKHLRFNVSA